MKKLVYKLIVRELSTTNGFSLIEVLLASSIFALLVTAVVGSLIYSQESDYIAGNRIRANLIAEESLEITRNIRDDSFSNLIDGDHSFSTSSGAWELSSSTNVIDIYTRYINISTVDANTKKIQSYVTWQDNERRNATATAITYLTDWGGTSQKIRAIEYYINDFSNVSYNLTLDQDLVSDYFVIVEGSDGDGTKNNNRGPDENYVFLHADPWGTGDLEISSGNLVLRFLRGNNINSWTGTITVVECLADCSTDGFNLLDISKTSFVNNNATGTDTLGDTWSDINQVVLFGGFMGSGAYTTETNNGEHNVCWAKIWPSSVSTINWERDSGSSLSACLSTIMAIEWGSNWDIQRVNVTGTSGGNGANVTGEYDTQTIISVVRDDTFVWATGISSDNGIGDGAEGMLITLGDGVNKNTNETLVAVGSEYSDTKDFIVYTITHDSLNTDYQFKADGNTNDLIYDIDVATTSDSTSRMSLVSNGCNGTGTAFPRPIFSSRFIDSNTIRVERRRFGQNFPAWVQSIDFSSI